ncbi:hypothetical protein LC55x_1322 [Lysobacter capsici]|uniref:Uncharacterized protein n=1 Tax=Lysobacter capsici AZ78 TaxID=1444315 RepID=A0A108U7Z4_9GAMM|nr:hypothetical protein LC55x_1322 [Lysobacter capsici]KWS04204.1 hypothetical protein AZ78_1753 [Lysobacter capsici AZ78]
MPSRAISKLLHPLKTLGRSSISARDKTKGLRRPLAPQAQHAMLDSLVGYSRPGRHPVPFRSGKTGRNTFLHSPAT